MFKGIIIDIKEQYAIVMKEGGDMVRVEKKKGMKVGQSIFFLEDDIYYNKTKQSTNSIRKWIVPIGAIAAMLIFIFNPIINILNPITDNTYAVLTLDVNPSVEFNLDKNGKIVNAIGLNDDGKALELGNINGLTVEEGISILRDTFSKENYLKNNNSVLVGFSFVGEEDINFEERIQNTIKSNFDNITVAYLKGTSEDIKSAENKGISLGKYEALLKLDEDNFEDALENLTTQEILELLKNKDGSLFISEDALEEIQDELEDRTEEEENEENDDDDDSDD